RSPASSESAKAPRQRPNPRRKTNPRRSPNKSRPRPPRLRRLLLRRRARDMEMKITTLEGKEAGSVKLPDAIFGLEPRTDIIQRCINWQLAKRQRGTHKTK